MSIDFEKVAKTIGDLTLRGGQLDPETSDGPLLWWQRACNGVALLVGDAPIRYLDHDFTHYRGSDGGTIVAFTDHIVAVARVAKAHPQPVSLIAISRATMTTLEVSQPWGDDSTAVRVEFGEHAFELPMSSRPSESVEELRQLVPSLALNLVPRTAP
jgi:hypothetical protein